MNLVAPFVRRPVGTGLLALGLGLVGLLAYRDLPVASLPNVDLPTIRVSAARPGADPETMASSVAAPLERRLGAIAGLHVPFQARRPRPRRRAPGRAKDRAARARLAQGTRDGTRQQDTQGLGAEVMQGYRIDLTPDDNGTLLVTCPALPMVTSHGEDEADAMRRAAGAVRLALETMVEDGDEVPLPSDPPGPGVVPVPLLTRVKLRLHGEARAAGVTRAELARRLGWDGARLDRLFRLDHASRLDHIEAAFAALGRVVEVRVGEAA